MNITIESLHYKFTAKFQYIREIYTFISSIWNKYLSKNETKNIKENKMIKLEKKDKKENFLDYFIVDLNKPDVLINKTTIELEDIIKNIENIYYRYNDVSASVLSKYYDSDEKCNTEIFDEYQQIITAENFVNSIDYYFKQILVLSDKMQLIPQFKLFTGNNENLIEDEEEDECLFLFENNKKIIKNKTSYKDVIEKISGMYFENKITFSVKLQSINDCDCGGKMILDPISSYKICELCGCEIYMTGTVFDDSQFYNQQGPLPKNKKYDYNKHCERWFNQLLGISNISNDPNFEEVIEKLDKRAIIEYTKNGKLRSMKNMKCKQIREWLKEYKFSTFFNDHIPFIRKTITGLHGEAVVPPEVTEIERLDILDDFSTDMSLYEQVSKQNDILLNVGKEKIKNKPYYPFVLLKVLCRKLKNDSRLLPLIEGIHFQSANTIAKNDLIYKKICEIRGIKPQPTDKTIILSID